jgi:hypothetical protein
MYRLIDDRCRQLGMTIIEPPDTTRLHWDISHVWLTVNGDWADPAIPSWAKQFQNDNLGGATHLYMLGFGVGGTRQKDADLFILGWPDGMHFFSPQPEHDWWGNALVTAGFPWNETPGPYYAQAAALSSAKLCGIGLPYPPLPWQPGADADAQGGVHVSVFVVMQEVEAYEPEPEPEPEPPGPEPDEVVGQFLRVLDKAEAIADERADLDETDQVAARIYLGIAKILSGEW